MTHPLTPREIVAQTVYDTVTRFDGDTVGTHLGLSSMIDASALTVDDERSIVMSVCEDIADSVLTALASGSGDHAELARLAEAATPGEWRAWVTRRRQPEIYTDGGPEGQNDKIASGVLRKEDAAFIAAANPAVVLDLLAEIAALRAENTEAERKLAEAVGRSDDLLKALEWYGEQARLARLIHSEGDAGRHALADDGGSRARAFIANHETIRIDAFLSKEAERG